MDDIDLKIKQVIFDKFKFNPLNSTLFSELVEDSIAKIEMLFEIEQFLGVRFNEEDLLSAETVGDLIDLAKKSTEKK